MMIINPPTNNPVNPAIGPTSVGDIPTAKAIAATINANTIAPNGYRYSLVLILRLAIVLI